MKKLTISLICMILATGTVIAQEQFTFGPKVGIDLTHLWGKDCPHGILFNYQTGAFLEYRFTDKFSIAPEVVFAAQGGKANVVEYLDESVITNGSANVLYHFNYINIPMILKFYVIPKLSIDLGPQVGINVYSKATVKAKAEGVSASYTKEFEGVKSVDFGLGLGATYNITDKIFVQGRYTMGLTRAVEAVDVMNGNIQLAAGYRF